MALGFGHLATGVTALSRNVLRCRSGAVAVEYALIGALVGIVVLAAAQAIGGKLVGTMGRISAALIAST